MSHCQNVCLFFQTLTVHFSDLDCVDQSHKFIASWILCSIYMPCVPRLCNTRNIKKEPVTGASTSILKFEPIYFRVSSSQWWGLVCVDSKIRRF